MKSAAVSARLARPLGAITLLLIASQLIAQSEAHITYIEVKLPLKVS
jgi:hypothetical protein